MIKNIAAVVLVIVWMMVIFIFSSSDGATSSKTSGKITNMVMEVIIEKNEGFDDYKSLKKKVSFIVRKCAHFMEYFILGLLLMNMMFILDIKVNRVILPVIIVIAYALSDELHQLLVIDRSCSIKDVLLDSSAGMIAIYIYYIFIVLRYEYEKVID